METTSINKRQASGNHGRSSAEPSPLGISNLVASTAPQQSTRGFVAPAVVAPVKKTPDIMDVLEPKNQKIEPVSQKVEEVNQKVEETSQKTDETYRKTDETYRKTNETYRKTNETSQKTEERTFSDHWRTMFEQVFAAVPTIYFSLKETCPELENNIIKVMVKNDIQKEHFEAKTREVLAFLRTHYDEKIEEIIVETNEKLEIKKIIYDVKDKLQNFKEQNEEFEDFLQILDLKIKD